MLLQYVVASTTSGNDEGNVVGTFAISVDGKGVIACCSNVCWNNIERVLLVITTLKKLLFVTQ